MHKLILVIGTGQAVLAEETKFKYKTADYFFENNPDKIYITPFVGEAIIRGENIFDEIYILGTKDSMWETLYARAIEENPTDDEIEFFEELSSLKEKEGILPNKPYWERIINKLEKYYDRKVFPLIIEIGKDTDERWKIFEAIANIAEENDKISIDITHGLRFQPFILTLALFYLKSIKNISIENVYYGALELSRDYYNGKTPIMNLKSLIDMIDWTNASYAFTKYGDTSTLADVLNEENYKELLKRAEYFNLVLQLNMVKDVNSNARRFVSQINNVNEKNLSPAFKLVKNKLKEFPEKLVNIESNWQTLLLLAEKHWENGQFGLAILSAWEAFMERVAEIYDLDIRNNFEDYQRISIIVRQCNVTKDIAKKISKFRNAVAHAEREKSFQPNQIKDSFPSAFMEEKKLLTDDNFKEKILKNCNLLKKRK